ncbi:MAG: putative toxin-antitoxin system toxin component, PIN family [Desulfobacterales bacterium]|nr:putative toxin-antitoxin system toxin component, PIN family [Desulfobacterales bacterium]
MKIVLDTNVLVSGLLTPFGSSGEIVRMVSAGILILNYDSRILLEYQEVLYRPKFQFDKEHIDTFLAYLKQNGQVISASPLKKRLPDPDDEPFLEIAIAGKAACLVTGNKSHFPRQSRQGIKILSPSEFIDFYRKYNKDPEHPRSG